MKRFACDVRDVFLFLALLIVWIGAYPVMIVVRGLEWLGLKRPPEPEYHKLPL